MVNSPARQLGQVAAPRLLPSGSARLQLTLPWTDGQVTLAQRVLGWHFGWHMHLTYSDIPTNLHQSPSNPLSKEGFSMFFVSSGFPDSSEASKRFSPAALASCADISCRAKRQFRRKAFCPLLWLLELPGHSIRAVIHIAILCYTQALLDYKECVSTCGQMIYNYIIHIQVISKHLATACNIHILVPRGRKLPGPAHPAGNTPPRIDFLPHRRDASPWFPCKPVLNALNALRRHQPPQPIANRGA